MAAKGKDSITRGFNEVIGEVDGKDQFDGEVNSDGDDGFILIWPDLQKTFENAKHVIDAIYNYRAALQKIFRNIGNYDFSDISKTVERFKKIAETEKKKIQRSQKNTCQCANSGMLKKIKATSRKYITSH